MRDASVKDTGFTYIENLVAMTVLAITAGMVTATNQHTLHLSRTALDRTRAVLLAWSAHEALYLPAATRRNRQPGPERFSVRLAGHKQNRRLVTRILVRWNTTGTRYGNTDPLCLAAQQQRNPGATRSHLSHSSFGSGCYYLETIQPEKRHAR